MKCVIFLSLLALAYAYPTIGDVGVGMGSRFRIQEDGSPIIVSPTGKQVILRKNVGVFHPEHIEAIVHGVGAPIKRYQIDTLTGLPISIRTPLQVLDYVQDARKILNNILEDVLDQQIMDQVEKNAQAGILDPVMWNVMNLWYKKQYLERNAFNPTTLQQAMTFWKQQYPFQVQGTDVSYLQEQVPIQELLYGTPYTQSQQYRTPLGHLEQLHFWQQYGALASPWEVQLALQLQQQMDILEQQIHYHAQQGHDVLSLNKFQQWQQLKRQQEALKELIQERYQQQQQQQTGNFWNFWTMTRQQPWNVWAPQQNMWQQPQYWNRLGQQQWSGVLGYPQQVGAWAQQMFPQQHQPIAVY